MKDKNTVFYKCKVCGNMIGLIDGNIDRIKCCGEPMELLVANSQEASTEKHIPVFEKAGDELIVQVGDVEHPMLEEHYIMWIAQVSPNQTTRIRLSPGDKPVVKFKYIPNSTIYAYCNIHGLWKADVEI